jgi:hypothetical protein
MKYFTKAFIECGDYLDYYQERDARTMTIEEDSKTTFTGLFDANGDEIHKERLKMGFM